MFQYKVTERLQNSYDKETKTYTKKPVQVATRATARTKRLPEIAKDLEKITSLSKGDVLSVLTEVGPLVARYAAEGYSINLGDLGTFTPRLSSTAVPVGEKYKAEHIRKLNIRYTPSVALKADLAATGFECLDMDGKCPAPDDSGKPTVDDGDDSSVI